MLTISTLVPLYFLLVSVRPGSISDQARAAQLNRQRLEAVDRISIVSRILQQSTALVRFGVRLARK